jgi:hypothetical protein
MTASIFKYFLRYLLFVCIPYSIAKKIERKYFNSNSNLGNKPDGPKLDLRGGAIPAGIIVLIMKDFAVKVAITGLFGSTIWSDTSDSITEQILRYTSSICAAPGYKFTNIVKKLRGINDQHTLDIKEILLEKNISNKEKLELIKIKIEYAMRNLKGKRRLIFVTTTISLLIFFLGNGTPAFAYFMASLRELIGGNDDEDTLRECIIEIYKEYNAPFPEELITKIMK